MVDRERLLITVRTYPTFSKSYIETVCTGGVNDRGEWRRLYPVSLRYEAEAKQYKTFDIVEVNLRSGSDGRTETRKPEMASLTITGHANDWCDRRHWIDRSICQSLAQLASKDRSIGPVAVMRVLEFIAKPAASDWSAEQKEQLKQTLMFGTRHELEKVPFDFRLRWEDQDGHEFNSLILAWEMYQTWREYRKHYSDPVKAMRDKFMSDIFGESKRLSLFMGNHHRFRDTWMVCGWFHPPKSETLDGSLF